MSQKLTWKEDILDHNDAKKMVETRSWKTARGLAQDGCCTVCHKTDETIEHLVPGCKVLANSEYVLKHNRALTIMGVAWVKEYGLVGGELVWYKENEIGKLRWDFEFHLHGLN